MGIGFSKIVESIASFQTNVMGTANILECLTSCPDLQAVLVITSDKVYQNNDDGRAFIENDPLGGDDPYSASKAATEIVTSSYAKSFFQAKSIPVASARAGNVIGGGDFSEDRLIPDIYKAAVSGNPVSLRHPNATRPWQHVLESLSGYFIYLEALSGKNSSNLPRALNFGPQKTERISVGDIANRIQNSFGIVENWSFDNTDTPPEKTLLSLNAELAHQSLNWKPSWNTSQTLDKTVSWYKAMMESRDMYLYSLRQIEEYATVDA